MKNFPKQNTEAYFYIPLLIVNSQTYYLCLGIFQKYISTAPNYALLLNLQNLIGIYYENNLKVNKYIFPFEYKVKIVILTAHFLTGTRLPVIDLNDAIGPVFQV